MLYVLTTITSQPVTEKTDSASGFLDVFNSITSTLQNIWWLILVLIAAAAAVLAIFNVRKESWNHRGSSYKIWRKVK